MAKEISDDNVILGVVGNKSDLYMKEQVKEKEGKNYADSIGAKFRLVSAKNDPHGFVNFLSELLDDFLKKNGILEINKNKIDLTINNNTKNNKEKKNCC